MENILNLSEEFPPFYTGHGIYLIRLHPYLQQHGYRYTVVTPRQLPSVSSSDQIGGIEVRRLEAFGTQRFLRYYLLTLAFMIRERHTYRIIHVNSFHDRFLLLLLLSRLLGKKVVVQMALLGSDDPMSFLRTFKFARLRFALIRRLTHKYLPISTPIEQSCLDAGIEPHKVRKIFQGVDLQRFHAASGPDEKRALRRHLQLPEHAPLAIFVGAVIERKGVRELLDAWTLVQGKMANAHLVIVGPYSFGEENVNIEGLNSFVSALRATIDNECLRVVLVGKTEKVAEYMCASDVFVFPSRKEGFGNVIIEAMACELPCIVTPMDGVADDTVVNGETGYIVHSAEEIAIRLIDLLSDAIRARTMGSRGRAVALRKFDIAQIAREYADLYRSM